MKTPREFEEQTEYYKNVGYNILKDIFNKKYNSYNAKNDVRRCTRCTGLVTTRRHYPYEDMDGILNQYPSLKKNHEKKIQEFVLNYLTHKTYFHNNIFEELIAKIWHYDNIHKFNDWDPELPSV